MKNEAGVKIKDKGYFSYTNRLRLLVAWGRNMEYIARHYNMDTALVWALRLEGKTDQQIFKELGWGLRTWDQWNFNECDERFGADWPGRDFESTPASKEKPDKSITIFDYHRLLSKTGWEVTHRIECPPLPS